MEHNSRKGRASHIMSLAIVLISAIFIVLARTGIIGREMDGVTKHNVVILWLDGSFVIAVVALGLGIGGLFTKGKRKIFAIIGTSLSMAIIIGIITFLPTYFKSHYGYAGIEQIFFAKSEARPSSPVSIFHATENYRNRLPSPLTKETIDSYLKANKRDVYDVQPAQLRYLINRIYAYYGYPFRKPEIRSLFYYPGSPFREDSSFSEEKISADHRAFVNYLQRIEKWKRQLDKRRSEGLLAYEKTQHERQFPFEGLSSLLAIDRHNNLSFKIDHDHLLIMEYPDGIPCRQLKLPSSVTVSSDFSAALSPNGKYISLSYYSENPVILLIDTTLPRLMHRIPAGYGEIRSHPQFDKKSSVLYTSAGAYDVITGKKKKNGYTQRIIRFPI